MEVASHNARILKSGLESGHELLIEVHDDLVQLGLLRAVLQLVLYHLSQAQVQVGCLCLVWYHGKHSRHCPAGLCRARHSDDLAEDGGPCNLECCSVSMPGLAGGQCVPAEPRNFNCTVKQKILSKCKCK